MSEKGLLKSVLDTLGLILGAVIVWFFIGAGWSGLHDWYYRVVREEFPSESGAERVGYTAFYIWISSLIAMLIIFGAVDSSAIVSKMVYAYLGLNMLFFLVTLIGFIYFLANLKKP